MLLNKQQNDIHVYMYKMYYYTPSVAHSMNNYASIRGPHHMYTAMN